MNKPLVWVGVGVGVFALLGLAWYLWEPTPEIRATATVTPAVHETTSAAASSATALPDAKALDAALAERQRADRDLDAALTLKTGGRWLEAREALRKFLAAYGDSARAADAKAMLGTVNMTILLSKIRSPEKVDVVIGAGDTLGKISSKYNVPIGLIVKSNGLKNEKDIRPGDKILVCPAQFSVLVEKSKMTLAISDNGQFFKAYRVGLGAANSTPTGEFKIVDRIAEPTWWREDRKQIPYGDPENILGTHWLSLNVPHYGIHGTWEPDTVGTQASKGCLRLLNSDIEELYTILPRQTPVRIVD